MVLIHPSTMQCMILVCTFIVPFPESTVKMRGGYDCVCVCVVWNYAIINACPGISDIDRGQN